MDAEPRRQLALGQPDSATKPKDEVGKALGRWLIRWHAAPTPPLRPTMGPLESAHHGAPSRCAARTSAAPTRCAARTSASTNDGAPPLRGLPVSPTAPRQRAYSDL